ncbi:hypothetical protein BDZ89DRAFT_134980 [Hymenopellis radicata]|nr:hypothetical protein BDZ89DRAFT_134980 [Hymenopellis radicata]
MLVLIASTLMATQVYGSYATWCIATNMDKRATRALVIPRPSQPASYVVDESFEYHPLAHSRMRSTEKTDTMFDTESFMTVPFFADAKPEPIEVSNPTISFSPYDFTGPLGGRDSILMFGSDQTRLGTERRSYNGTSLPM